MTGQEVKKLKDEEIAVEVKRLRERLFQLRNQAQTEKVEDTSQFIKVRRDIARLLTERASRTHGPTPAPATGQPAAPARKPAARKPAAKSVKKVKSTKSTKPAAKGRKSAKA